MRFIDAVRTAGKNGVIARAGADQVLLVRSFNFTTGAAVILHASDHEMGNWTPSSEDLEARDWDVIAKSRVAFVAGS